MRGHLIECFEKGILTPFPKKRITREQKVKSQSQRIGGEWVSPRKAGKERKVREMEETKTSNSFAILDDGNDCMKPTEVPVSKTRRTDKVKWKAGDLILNLSEPSRTSIQAFSASRS